MMSHRERCAVPRLFAAFLILLAVTAMTPAAFPQASTAAVSGTVRDESHAVVAAAPVVLTNTATNTAIRTSTNEAGFYFLPGIVPGTYRLQVEAAGMEKFQATLTVQLQQRAVVDVVLRVATAATQVTVVGDVTPLLTTDSPTLGHTLERDRIEQLPINGRQITSLLVTSPGLEGMKAYGEHYMSQDVTLDGATLFNTYWQYNITQRQPSLDSIQEMKVENNNSSAKFDHPTSIMFSTKNGTNQIHGAAFETNRNSGYGVARARTDYYNKPPFLNRNEFGASAGGPVVLPKLYDGRNRTFWFFSYEGMRKANPTTKGVSVPTGAMRQGDFSGLKDANGRPYTLYNPYSTDSATWARQPFPNNTIPQSMQSPLAKFLFSITPDPTFPTVQPTAASNLFSLWGNYTTSSTIATRIDQQFSDRDRLYGRFSRDTYVSTYQQGSFPTLITPPGSTRSDTPSSSAALNYTRMFSPTLFNELLVAFSRDHWYKGKLDVGTDWSERLGLPNAVSYLGWLGVNGGTLSGYNFSGASLQYQWLNHIILDDNITKIHGRHELLAGVHFRYDQNTIIPDSIDGGINPSTQATSLFDPASSRTNPQALPYTGADLANLYLGVMNYTNTFVHPTYYLRNKDYALYFQDNIKATPRLTLNLGLRWQYMSPYSDKYGRMSSFDLKNHAVVLGTPLDKLYQTIPLASAVTAKQQSFGAQFESYQDAGLPPALYSSTHRNFGPRIGFAYRTGDGARPLVVRGGYSIFYNRLFLRDFTYPGASNPPFSGTFKNSLTDATVSPDGIANYGLRSMPAIIAGSNSRNAISASQLTGVTRGSATVTYYGESTARDPRVQEWNLTLEKQLMNNTVARVGYVGQHTDFLALYEQINPAMPNNVWYLATGTTAPTGDYANVARRPYDSRSYGDITAIRNAGIANASGVQFELERRYTKGYAFQIFYVLLNSFNDTGDGNWNAVPGGGGEGVPAANQWLPGVVPTDFKERARFLTYHRDAMTPKHRINWNWLVDVPVGKGKPLGGNMRGALDKIVGGWQIAGMGSLISRYLNYDGTSPSSSLSTSWYPTGNALEVYGNKYPIQDCRSGTCYPGFLWYNGYIPANQINSVDPKTGKPNGIMGVPAGYKPAAAPLIPYGSTTLPANAPANTNISAYWDSNTIWVPLKNGSVVATTSPALNPWRNQYVMGPMLWNVDASLFKRIPIRERFEMRFNIDAFNVFNHPGDPAAVSSLGVLSTRGSANSPRQLQLTLRLTW